MNTFQVTLSMQQTGAEVLVHIAYYRLDGVLYYSHQNSACCMYFQEGSPIAVSLQAGDFCQDVETLLLCLHNIALATSGLVQFDARAKPDKTLVQRHDIDTVSQVMLILFEHLSIDTIKHILHARQHVEIKLAIYFHKIAAAIKRISDIDIADALHLTSLKSWPLMHEAQQKAWTIALLLGGVQPVAHAGLHFHHVEKMLSDTELNTINHRLRKITQRATPFKTLFKR